MAYKWGSPPQPRTVAFYHRRVGELVQEKPCTLTSGALRRGSTTLPHKQGTYLTTRGRLTLDEYNAACRDFTPAICQEPYRFLDDAWVRGHADTPLADELYRIDQRGSVLEGRGAGVTRAEMDEIRAKRAAT